MSKERMGNLQGAAIWLPFFFGALLFSGRAHAQTAGVPPLMNGDCTVSGMGVAVCTKSNGVLLQASATTDTTNAANIASGTLPAARMCSGAASAYFYCDRSTGAWTAIAAAPAVSSAVAITGGSINGATIGATAPSSGMFTTLSATGAITSTGSYLQSMGGVPATTANSAYLDFSGRSRMWATGANTATYGGFLFLQSSANASLLYQPMLFDSSLTLGMACGSGASAALAPCNVKVTPAGAVTASRLVSSSVSGNGLNQPLYTPTSSSAACTAGDFADDANFHYVCVAANSWKRAALSAF